MIEGVLAAVPTPFDVDKIAERAFADHLAGLVSEGVAGLSPCGITGEGSTLSVEERWRLVTVAVETAAQRALVIPATGTNSTASTLMLTRQAKEAGADAVLIVVPYYSRPSQEGIWRHFEAVARAVDIPILIHNATARTAVTLPPATVARLATIPTVVGIVDDTDQHRWQVIADRVPDTFRQMCGVDDRMAVEALSGRGRCLSSLANVAPSLCVSLQRAAADRNDDVAFGMQAALNRFRICLGDVDETAAIKFIIERSRPAFSRSVRLPLVGVPDDVAPQLAAAFDVLCETASRVGVSPRRGAWGGLRSRSGLDASSCEGVTSC